MWAEEVGIGDMGLSPEEFWNLETREFLIKHEAFTRAEDRARALVFELALGTGEYKDSERAQMERQMRALRRYPEKQWLNRPA